MDFIVQRTFDDLPMNFAVIDDKENLISNRILGIDSNSDGHSLSTLFLRFEESLFILNIYFVVINWIHFYIEQGIYTELSTSSTQTARHNYTGFKENM